MTKFKRIFSYLIWLASQIANSNAYIYFPTMTRGEKRKGASEKKKEPHHLVRLERTPNPFKCLQSPILSSASARPAAVFIVKVETSLCREYRLTFSSGFCKRSSSAVYGVRIKHRERHVYSADSGLKSFPELWYWDKCIAGQINLSILMHVQCPLCTMGYSKFSNLPHSVVEKLRAAQIVCTKSCCLLGENSLF